ncbi:ABC transporter transmembrane region 2-domain-containing protein [Abortiporus biennis]|nr:ABC transporter transmembrane region 2-domain-containing protein [Abortiporus biennis]
MFPSSLPKVNLPQTSRRPILVAVFTILLLRSRLVSAPTSLLEKLKSTAIPKKKALSQEELEQTLQQLYVSEPDGSKTLLVPYGDQVSRVRIHETPLSILKSTAKDFPLIPASHKPNLDKTFLRQLFAIAKIAFPSWTSKEVLILILHSFFLVSRTVLSVVVAHLDGRIVRDLVSANGKGFLKGLGLWFLLAVPSTYTNTMIKHLQAKLSLRMRTRINRYTNDLYLSSSPDLRYYRVSQELDGVDQYITSDVSAFCDALSGIYGNVMKPSLDLLLFTSQLSRTLGLRGTLLLFVNYYLTAKILRAVTPAFGRLAAVEARLEGEYRAGMSRVGRESEEVAFYNGGPRERDILWRAYLRLIKHINSIYKIRIAYEWTEDYVIKYLWSAAGYALIAIPVLLTRTRNVGVQTAVAAVGQMTRKNDEVANRTETYISSRRLLLSLADAGGRLMYAYKDLLELAGLTTRLYTLLSTLHNLKPLPIPEPTESVELSHVDVAVPSSFTSSASHHHPEEGDEVSDGGEPKKESYILVKDLSLVLKPGEHLMITGSNGVGKTAIARVLAGLWAPYASRRGEESGKVKRPSGKEGLFVVPQRSYMVTGTLLDQIIYPHSYAQFVESGRTTEELISILTAVNLAYLPSREGGWHTRKEWRDVLSGGEKQRMGMARVFYHLPKFAVLDECTSAVSSDVEGRMYEHAKSLGITLITISLRPSLTKYHNQLLTITGDGTGSWTLHRIGTQEERMELDREITSLENKLAKVEGWEKRVVELTKALSVQEK